MFDITVSVADVQVVPAEDHVKLSLVVAMALPTPQGIMQLPVGLVSVNFSGESAVAKGQELIEAGQNIQPRPEETLAKSGFQVATSMQDVDQVAQTHEAFRKGSEAK